MAKEKITASGKNNPVWKKALKGVHVAVFGNESENGFFYKTTLQRVYKSKDDKFETTNSLSRDDIPVAVMLLEEAYAWILEAEANKSKDAE